MIICNSVQTAISKSIVPHLLSVQYADSAEYLRSFLSIYLNYYNQMKTLFDVNDVFGTFQWKESVDLMLNEIGVYITPALDEVSISSQIDQKSFLSHFSSVCSYQLTVYLEKQEISPNDGHSFLRSFLSTISSDLLQKQFLTIVNEYVSDISVNAIFRF